MDIMSPEKRSRLMSRVRSRDTGPEMLLRRALWSAGYRYRLGHRLKLPGKPDLVFPRARLAVYVDGCFWHACPEHATQPTTRSEWWREKIQGNVSRDRRVDAQMAELGWTVMRFWEHEVENDVDLVVQKIAGFMSTGEVPRSAYSPPR